VDDLQEGKRRTASWHRSERERGREKEREREIRHQSTRHKQVE
jgi:hypothetical protein